MLLLQRVDVDWDWSSRIFRRNCFTRIFDELFNRFFVKKKIWQVLASISSRLWGSCHMHEIILVRLCTCSEVPSKLTRCVRSGGWARSGLMFIDSWQSVGVHSAFVHSHRQFSSWKANLPLLGAYNYIHIHTRTPVWLGPKDRNIIGVCWQGIVSKHSRPQGWGLIHVFWAAAFCRSLPQRK